MKYGKYDFASWTNSQSVWTLKMHQNEDKIRGEKFVFKSKLRVANHIIYMKKETDSAARKNSQSIRTNKHNNIYIQR